jgi:hypothetical protein
MTQSGHDRLPGAAVTPPPPANGDVVGVAVALLEAAALAAAMRRAGIWNPHLHLDAATDRMWASAGSGGRGEWRTDPGEQAAKVRLAVLVAQATIGRCLAGDGYLSARQLSVDLRQAAAWLAAGAQFGA